MDIAPDVDRYVDWSNLLVIPHQNYSAPSSDWMGCIIDLVIGTFLQW